MLGPATLVTEKHDAWEIVATEYHHGGEVGVIGDHDALFSLGSGHDFVIWSAWSPHSAV